MNRVVSDAYVAPNGITREKDTHDASGAFCAEYNARQVLCVRPSATGPYEMGQSSTFPRVRRVFWIFVEKEKYKICIYIFLVSLEEYSAIVRLLNGRIKGNHRLRLLRLKECGGRAAELGHSVIDFCCFFEQFVRVWIDLAIPVVTGGNGLVWWWLFCPDSLILTDYSAT